MNTIVLDLSTPSPCRVNLRWFTRLTALIILSVPTFAYALGWVWIPDVSLVTYQLSPDGRVYFRNLNQFNSAALGCCYNYWIDTTAQHGKNQFALFLSKQAQGKGLNFSIPDNGAPGTIDYIGEY